MWKEKEKNYNTKQKQNESNRSMSFQLVTNKLTDIHITQK